MSKRKKSSKKPEDQFTKDYNDLMSTGTFKGESSHEWSESGDQIQKFTIYENYTPVKTSTGTGTMV